MYCVYMHTIYAYIYVIGITRYVYMSICYISICLYVMLQNKIWSVKCLITSRRQIYKNIALKENVKTLMPGLIYSQCDHLVS